MSAHHAIVAAGPGVIRRLCCGTSAVPAAEVSETLDAALGAIDDRVALVGERPVSVDSLWRSALRSLDCATPDARKTTVIVHPSWWPSSRVGVLTSAAGSLSGEVLVRPRSWLLTHTPNVDPEATVVVEIAEQLVGIVGAGVVGVPRRSEPYAVAADVIRAIDEMRPGTAVSVLIDAPSAVAGAPALATLIARAVRDSGQASVVIDDARLSRLAASAQSGLSASDEPSRPQSSVSGGGSRVRMFRGLVMAGVVLAAAVPAVAAVGRHGIVPGKTAPTTLLVEGRVALTVPADWAVQRVLAGPGSARLQATSPADPELALHVTQSPVPPDETLSATADRLKRAIGTEPAGVFVDFNPSGIGAGRPAVTYREVRASHHVRWTVMLDGPVRISVGCQSPLGGEEAVREVCEQAVRSAHAIG